MSGKKQHHIPQSVQRGFLFDVTAEKTYVHRRDGRHFPASISDVLAQRYFYSRRSSDGSVTLDDRITEYENRLGGLLIKLREIPIDGDVDAELAAEVIAHLTPRSANMRRIFGSSMEQIMTAMVEAFADEDTVVSMLGLAEPEPNPVWNDHIAQMFEKEPKLKKLFDLIPIERSLLDRMVFMAVKEHFVGSFDAESLGNTEEEVTKYSETVQRVVNALRVGFNLDLLDGITFTTNFQAALNELDHEFDINTTPEGVPDHIAQGAATALVLCGNVPKIRIILNAKYAVSLVEEETRDAEATVHLIVAGIAQVDTLGRIEKALPGFLLEPILMSDHDGVLHCAVRKALRAYRYAHDSADFGANDLFEQEFSKYLKATFDAAYAKIAKAKEEHAKTSDFPKLFEVTHGAAADILISVARLIGHRHGIGKFELSEADPSVVSALSARQLISWAEVFSKDLQRFWKKETWTRSDFYSLNIHAERVLWASGVLLWRDPNGKGTMIMAVPPLPQAGEHLGQ